MSAGRTFRPRLLWHDGAFRSDLAFDVGANGRLGDVRVADGAGTALDGAVLPGFVNAHSHAFQRGLRGRGETFALGRGSFWSWREAMYELVEQLDPEKAYALSQSAFREMLAAGMTTVGEFHYVRHDATGRGYALDDAVLAAAHDAGIRIALLVAHYRTGGIDAPLLGGQRRFDSGIVAEYWRRHDELAGRLRGPTQTLGAVAHSIRAAPIDDVVDLAREARTRGIVLHMHVEEQHQEIAACRERYGRTPTRLLLEHDVVTPTFTAVHCTHTTDEDAAALLAAGGRVCLCPLTEANLGDGLADGPGLHRGREQICLGTDSNARISMLEEMRWLEYGQRLRLETRGVWTDDHGAVGPALLETATRGGARSLGLDVGRFGPGAHADFIEIDLGAPSLAGVDADLLPAALALGAPDAVVRRTWVGGRLVSGASDVGMSIHTDM